MKKYKKIALFLVLAMAVSLLFSVTALAASPESADDGAGKLDMNLTPESFGERLEYAVQGTATGILMVFGVLTLLTLILYGSKYVFYDIPNKKREARIAAKKKSAEMSATDPTDNDAVAPAEVTAQRSEDEGELIAVITAAVAAMIESGEYKNEFAGGFRVVSFKRSAKTAWNK